MPTIPPRLMRQPTEAPPAQMAEFHRSESFSNDPEIHRHHRRMMWRNYLRFATIRTHIGQLLSRNYNKSIFKILLILIFRYD